MTFSERYKLFYRHGLGFLLTQPEQFKSYQYKARIYLDEFPEIEECDLRVNFDTSLLMKRFLNKG